MDFSQFTESSFQNNYKSLSRKSPDSRLLKYHTTTPFMITEKLVRI
jgi:hypothetical protein